MATEQMSLEGSTRTSRLLQRAYKKAMPTRKTIVTGLFAGLMFGVLTQPAPVMADTGVMQAVDQSTQFLIGNWKKDQQLRKVYPPQVLPLAEGSKIYGACGEQVSGYEVGGSSYCGITHTIYLVPEQLKDFYKAFGPSAVAYIVAHEFGHAIQAAYGVKLQGPARELQADCLSGLVFRMGSKELGITRDDVLAMAGAAYSIGSNSHGSGAQRTYALLSGMGVFKATCEGGQMLALAEGRLQVPALQQLRQQRSGGSRPDTSQTPYPKTLGTALGL